ncbi:MAG: hypothetical protein KatS3mg077_0823 [Candidatus Binatia bacterium]|nr:MAG: hypothetical protein KatS3mg077_0823 [Candidatus Binatia bacterium]
MRWSLGVALAIVLGYSVALILFDEFIAKPWRQRRWKRRAAAGDPEAQEILARARQHSNSEEA